MLDTVLYGVVCRIAVFILKLQQEGVPFFRGDNYDVIAVMGNVSDGETMVYHGFAGAVMVYYIIKGKRLYCGLVIFDLACIVRGCGIGIARAADAVLHGICRQVFYVNINKYKLVFRMVKISIGPFFPVEIIAYSYRVVVARVIQRFGNGQAGLPVDLFYENILASGKAGKCDVVVIFRIDAHFHGQNKQHDQQERKYLLH